jgi:hypothetical protein
VTKAEQSIDWSPENLETLERFRTKTGAESETSAAADFILGRTISFLLSLFLGPFER